MLRAVLFDLDDTLFDHRLCARQALAALHAAHDCFHTCPFPAFERMHASFLEELHRRVMTGELPLDEARQMRFKRLFEAVGVNPETELVARAAAAYRDGYRELRKPIAGAVDLLALVKTRATVGIVSNNLREEQADKLRHCGLDAYVDALIVSEEAGVSKPDPEIFRIALRALDCGASEVVMVGDSWSADVVGARAAGIAPIWFNPLGAPAPDPTEGVVELRSLQPADAALSVIFSVTPAGEPAVNSR